MKIGWFTPVGHGRAGSRVQPSGARGDGRAVRACPVLRPPLGGLSARNPRRGPRCGVTAATGPQVARRDLLRARQRPRAARLDFRDGPSAARDRRVARSDVSSLLPRLLPRASRSAGPLRRADGRALRRHGLASAQQVLGPWFDSGDARRGGALRYTFAAAALRGASGAIVHSRPFGSVVPRLWSGPVFEASLPEELFTASVVRGSTREGFCGLRGGRLFARGAAAPSRRPARWPSGSRARSARRSGASGRNSTRQGSAR